MVDAASLVASDLRLSVQRYTLLFEWLGIEECARTPGSFHPLIKLTFFSFCTCLDKQRTYGKTYADDVARSNFTPAGEAVYIDLDVDSVCVVLLFFGVFGSLHPNSRLPVSLLLLLLHPFSVSHLKLLLLSVDSFARLKKRSRITE